MDQRDEGDESDAWEEGTRALARTPHSLADDYARHLAAERRWQNRRAAMRLWEQVKRWIALGR